MSDSPPESSATKSCRRRVEMFERQIEAREKKRDAATDEKERAMYEDWLRRDRESLGQWKRDLAKAIEEAKPVKPLV